MCPYPLRTSWFVRFEINIYWKSCEALEVSLFLTSVALQLLDIWIKTYESIDGSNT